jgi:hypothetical protein
MLICETEYGQHWHEELRCARTVHDHQRRLQVVPWMEGFRPL